MITCKLRVKMQHNFAAIFGEAQLSFYRKSPITIYRQLFFSQSDMASNVLTIDTMEPIKRRIYSKKGCKECKRRKIKCDEGLPSCWQCQRLKKVCEYPKSGEKVKRASIRKLQWETERPNIENGDKNQVKQGSEQRQGRKDSSSSILKLLNDGPAIATAYQNAVHRQAQQLEKELLTPTQQTLAAPSSNYNSIVSSHLDSMGSQLLDNGEPPQPGLHALGMPQPSDILANINTSIPIQDSLTPTMEELDQFVFSIDDLNLLASDLNSIVNNIMFESNFDIKSNAMEKTHSELPRRSSGELQYQPIPDSNPVPISNNTHVAPGVAFYDNNGLGGTSDPIIPKSVPLDFIKVTSQHEKLYLEEFYNEFAGVILPFHAYDEATSTYNNPARDILLTCATKETYLLAAMLAQGAKVSFKKSGIQEDEKAYCFYLSKCLQLLEPAIDGNEANSRELTTRIESVLLTILLLTSANASNSKQNWRDLLRGAKDILLKYSSNNAKLKLIKTSPILIFCKYWYISIEILAGLSSEFGGTLKEDQQLDLLITPGAPFEIQIMKSLNVITEDGFNILFGYHNLCITHLKDLIKILNKIRMKEVTPAKMSEYMRLLSEFYQQRQLFYIDQSGFVDQSRLHSIKPGGSLIETFSSSISNKLLVSWLDVLHQSYMVACQITILTKCFNISTASPQIQELVIEFVDMLKFLNYPEPPTIKYSALMIQWPVQLIGLYCTREDDRFLVMKFLRHSAQIGSGSAGISLRRMHKQWLRRMTGSNEEDDGDSEVDLMSY